MRVDNCFFCSGPCYPGHGMTFVRNDCKVFKFCRPKCHKAYVKKKNPRKTRWTKAFRKAAGKEMKVDATYEFEKRRNTPVRYDRDLVAATIGAIKRVGAIRAARDARFHAARMTGRAAAETAVRAATLTRHVALVAPAVVRAARTKAELTELVTARAGVKTRAARLAAALAGGDAVMQE